MKIVAAIPSFRGLNTLQRCLDSCKMFDEIIVLFDEEKTKNHCQFIETNPVPLFYSHQSNKGVIATRNTLINIALDLNSDYVVFVDDDDYFLGHAYSLIKSTITETKELFYYSEPLGAVEDNKEDTLNLSTFIIEGIRHRDKHIFSTKLFTDHGLRFDLNGERWYSDVQTIMLRTLSITDGHHINIPYIMYTGKQSRWIEPLKNNH
jgi:glycosyltransferase involved in cell wall biosynthesis